tara:strand:- start:2532 stop:3059 length:528 start_codon:yes stop_codon:yes gene_type:complete
MVVAEILTGISLVKASVDFIKNNISTCQDIGQIAGQIDDLFKGEKQAQQLRNKKAGGSGLGDQFGVNTVAKEIIDARLAAEQLQEVATMVDMRFGHGTWSGIIAERAKRIQEAKEAAAKARKMERLRQKELMDNVKIGLGVFFLVAVCIGLFFFLMLSVAVATVGLDAKEITETI